ncbi:hypothetical protein GCM10010435_76590 [Winogradskya consettensis]|uniref:Uncharacterized protein n=1 Tax=Winogradskya consettensis TaxID=113560 RepID=A0A919SN47_9ACTN|nr:hypothetical protein [Actinoplanes consettensis]GIM74539.1 hypothetical protein Aco04nite_40800 [Actinoplanes consettensis]
MTWRRAVKPHAVLPASTAARSASAMRARVAAGIRELFAAGALDEGNPDIYDARIDAWAVRVATENEIALLRQEQELRGRLETMRAELRRAEAERDEAEGVLRAVRGGGDERQTDRRRPHVVRPMATRERQQRES